MLWGGRWEGGSCFRTHVRIKDLKIIKIIKIIIINLKKRKQCPCLCILIQLQYKYTPSSPKMQVSNTLLEEATLEGVSSRGPFQNPDAVINSWSK